MINLIIGNKGTGKTKKMIEMATEALNKSAGSVVAIEKGSKLTYDLTHKVRLINTEQYSINGYDSFYGLLSGLYAGNYDITDIFVESVFDICGKDIEKFIDLISKLNNLSDNNINITLVVSDDINNIPNNIKANIIQTV